MKFEKWNEFSIFCGNVVIVNRIDEGLMFLIYLVLLVWGDDDVLLVFC